LGGGIAVEETDLVEEDAVIEEDVEVEEGVEIEEIEVLNWNKTEGGDLGTLVGSDVVGRVE
jgi:hypothetical protein